MRIEREFNSGNSPLKPNNKNNQETPHVRKDSLDAANKAEKLIKELTVGVDETYEAQRSLEDETLPGSCKS